jgi:hypothetical protein
MIDEGQVRLSSLPRILRQDSIFFSGIECNHVVQKVLTCIISLGYNETFLKARGVSR